jgi:branched-chain amino acid aminotransferase
VFAVRRGVVHTPPLSSGCLEGVTRGVLMEVAHGLGIPMDERVLTPDDLRAADEIFISSTSRNLIGVEAIGEHSYPNAPGPVTRRLEAAFAAYVADYIAKCTAGAERK